MKIIAALIVFSFSAFTSANCFASNTVEWSIYRVKNGSIEYSFRDLITEQITSVWEDSTCIKKAPSHNGRYSVAGIGCQFNDGKTYVATAACDPNIIGWKDTEFLSFDGKNGFYISCKTKQYVPYVPTYEYYPSYEYTPNSGRRGLQGCCSWHGGVCGGSPGSIMCCDGTQSPSC